MFPKYIHYLLFNFNLWGFCAELPELRMSQTWTRLILIGQLLCSGLVCAFVYQTLTENYSINLDFLTKTNVVLKLCGIFIGAWFIVIESYWKRPSQRKFWQIYHRIGIEFKGVNYKTALGTYFLKFGLFFVISAGVSVQHLVGLITVFDKKSLPLLFSFFFLMVMEEMRIFYYLFYVSLLHHHLSEIEMEMKSLADSSEHRAISPQRLRWVRMYYDLVYEVSNCMNDVFGWSQFSSVLYSFVRLVSDLNWIYWQIHNGFILPKRGMSAISPENIVHPNHS